MNELKSKLNWFFLLTIVCIFWICSFIIVLIVQPFSTDEYWIYSSIQFFTTAIFGVIGIGFAMKSLSFKSTNGKIMGLLMIGMIFFSIAEFLYLIYINILLLDIYPSPADIFWVLALIPIAIAFIWQAKIIEIEINKKYLIIFLIIIGAFTVLVLFLEIIPVILEPISPAFPLEQKFLGLWYPIGNIIITMLAGFIIIKYLDGKMSYAWLLILVGFICQVISDTWYAMLAIDNSYNVYHPVDIFWIIGYILIGLGGFYQVFLLKKEI